MKGEENMSCIEDLTQDEKVAVCTLISGRWFRELFKSNEQEFTKLRKGFRAATHPPSSG